MSFCVFRCAGKLIHDVLANADSEQSVRIMERFGEECILLSKLRHPNLVLFMGVYFKDGVDLPVLVMELLTTSLDGALSRYPNMPAYMKNVILYDVACGLNFFHGKNPPIIHRDLTSKNVLLSENFRAKIADLGVAKIVSSTGIIPPQSDNQKLTVAPGTPHFMPPEAFPEDPQYDQSLDMFSFGVLILNVVNQVWPRPVSNVEKSGVIVQEVVRRKRDLDEMGEAHNLREFTERCLCNNGAERPSASDATEKLFQEIKSNHPPFTDAIQMIQHISTLSAEAMEAEQMNAGLKQEKEDIEGRNTTLKNENIRLERDLDLLRKEKDQNRDLLLKKTGDIERLNIEVATKNDMIRGKEQYTEAIKQENLSLRAEYKVRFIRP